MAKIKEGKPITIWGDGSVTRDYVYVEDVANAFAKSLLQDSDYRIFNIGTGVGPSLRQLISEMERVTGMRAQVEYAPARASDVSMNVLDSTRAQRHMNWRIETNLDDGLRKTWAWLCGS